MGEGGCGQRGRLLVPGGGEGAHLLSAIASGRSQHRGGLGVWVYCTRTPSAAASTQAENGPITDRGQLRTPTDMHGDATPCELDPSQNRFSPCAAAGAPRHHYRQRCARLAAAGRATLRYAPATAARSRRSHRHWSSDTHRSPPPSTPPAARVLSRPPPLLACPASARGVRATTATRNRRWPRVLPPPESPVPTIVCTRDTGNTVCPGKLPPTLSTRSSSLRRHHHPSLPCRPG